MPGNSELQSSMITTCAANKKAEEKKLDNTCGSEGYENDFEAASDFRKLAVKNEDRVSEDALYGTKWSALDALPLLNLQIVDGYWCGVGFGVRKYWEQDTRLSQALRHVLDAMTEEEIKMLRDDEEYIENLEALQENAGGRGLKMGFDMILESLTEVSRFGRGVTVLSLSGRSGSGLEPVWQHYRIPELHSRCFGIFGYRKDH
ncbi:hypothetical protein LTR49_001361 [Elasticomyces elasticus]|nr:hypothetical protein LTR49_001361 [Elasticomyces elasticus]